MDPWVHAVDIKSWPYHLLSQQKATLIRFFQSSSVQSQWVQENVIFLFLAFKSGPEWWPSAVVAPPSSRSDMLWDPEMFFSPQLWIVVSKLPLPFCQLHQLQPFCSDHRTAAVYIQRKKKTSMDCYVWNPMEYITWSQIPHQVMTL